MATKEYQALSEGQHAMCEDHPKYKELAAKHETIRAEIEFLSNYLNDANLGPYQVIIRNRMLKRAQDQEFQTTHMIAGLVHLISKTPTVGTTAVAGQIREDD